MKSYIYTLGAALLASGAQAMAQSYYSSGYSYDTRPIQWHFDGGYGVTTGRTADYLNNGWTIGGGFTWHPDPGGPFSLRTDLNYSRFGATDQLITLGELQTQTQIDDGNGQIVDLDMDGVYEFPVAPAVRGYLLGGVGVAHRRLELTQTVAYGGVVCDSWWGFCGVGYAPGDVVVASQNTTRFTWNAGAGLDISIGGGQSWFVEARYTRIETPVPTDFVPIRVGIRF
jgi:Outer membrane protein beta-barrel domain